MQRPKDDWRVRFLARQLLLGSQRAGENRRDFMRTQLVFWLLAAIDGHAKNFSVFLLPAGAFQLTPRYAVLNIGNMIGKITDAQANLKF